MVRLHQNIDCGFQAITSLYLQVNGSKGKYYKTTANSEGVKAVPKKICNVCVVYRTYFEPMYIIKNNR